MAKVSELNELSKDSLLDTDNYVLVSEGDKLRKISTIDLANKITTAPSEDVVNFVATGRWNSFPSNCQLIQLVTAEIDDIATESSGSMNTIDTENKLSIINALIEFMDCIKRDTNDVGDLIDQLRIYVDSKSEFMSEFDEDQSESSIDILYIDAVNILIDIINYFRNSPDYGYITTTIKTSTGLSNLNSNSNQEIVANALLFLISRFSQKEVAIMTYNKEIHGGGVVI